MDEMNEIYGLVSIDSETKELMKSERENQRQLSLDESEHTSISFFLKKSYIVT